MSAMAGIVYNMPRPSQPRRLTGALAALRPMGPDGETQWADPRADLAHLALHTTPEHERERWPLYHERGDWLLCDARLDNRDELLATLPLSATSTDADLILAAHVKWGRQACAHLIGDFAYAWWDAAHDSLMLVRSPFGHKGLYYRLTDEGICFASTLRGVMALAPDGLTLNDPWVANFLTLEMTRSADETVWREIRKVPPAHALLWFSGHGIRTINRYWSLSPMPQYADLSDDDWRDLFRTTFTTAVAASLRSHRPLSIAASGGVDSSAMAGIAHELVAQNPNSPPVYVYSDRMAGWPDTEEGVYRDLMVRRLPHFRSHWIEVERAWTWQTVAAWQTHASTPMNLSNTYWAEARMAAARAAGCRTQLLGMGGDFITGEEDYYMPQAFYSLPLAEQVREGRYFLHGSVRGALKFGKALANYHLPAGLFNRIERGRGHGVLYTRAAEEAGRGQPRDRSRYPDETLLMAHMRQVLEHPLYLLPFEQMGEQFALHGLELRTPFYDRRLVTLCYHLPPHLRRRGGQTRVLLKQALADVLAPELLARKHKAGFSRFTAFSVPRPDHDRAMALSADALTLRRGWIDPTRWATIAAHPTQPMAVIWAHRVAHLEAWLRQIQQKPEAVPSHPS